MENKLETLQAKIVKLDRNLRSIASSFSTDKMDADDIYGEIVIAILTHSSENDSNSRILARAKWTCLDITRHGKVIDKHTQIEFSADARNDGSDVDADEDEQDRQDSLFHSSQTPEDTVISAEMQLLVAQAVAGMAPEYQQIVRMLAGGDNYAEIATKMNVSRPAITQRVQKIRQVLVGAMA
jgi:RNA polymerase sigma factor (sigma-70 family)